LADDAEHAVAEIGDDIAAVVSSEYGGVRAGIAVQLVVPNAADEGIVAVVADDRIGAVAAGQDIVALETDHQIVARPAVERVRGAGADQRVVVGHAHGFEHADAVVQASGREQVGGAAHHRGCQGGGAVEHQRCVVVDAAHVGERAVASLAAFAARPPYGFARARFGSRVGQTTM
jgi:hypothetical protein